MKEIKDDVAMGLGVAAAAGCGLIGMINPMKAQDMTYTGAGRNDADRRMHGHTALATAALMCGTMGDRMTHSGRKDMFKVSGAAWGTMAAHNAVNMYKGIQKKDAKNGAEMAAAAAISALHLWKGFKKD